MKILFLLLKHHSENTNQKFLEISSFDDLKKELERINLLVFNLTNIKNLQEVKEWFAYLSENKIQNPVIIKKTYNNTNYE